MKKTLLIGVTAFVLGFAVGSLLTRSVILRDWTKSDVVFKTDTLIVRDTIRETSPEHISSSVVGSILILTSIETPETGHVPSVVFVTDTVMVHDTTYVVLEREQRYYKGDGWEAYVSGYDPTLDALNIFNEHYVVNNTEIHIPKPKRWGLGVQAGYGIGYANGRVCGVPYIGVGISYNIFSW